MVCPGRSSLRPPHDARAALVLCSIKQATTDQRSGDHGGSLLLTAYRPTAALPALRSAGNIYPSVTGGRSNAVLPGICRHIACLQGTSSMRIPSNFGQCWHPACHWTLPYTKHSYPQRMPQN